MRVEDLEFSGHPHPVPWERQNSCISIHRAAASSGVWRPLSSREAWGLLVPSAAGDNRDRNIHKLFPLGRGLGLAPPPLEQRCLAVARAAVGDSLQAYVIPARKSSAPKGPCFGN